MLRIKPYHMEHSVYKKGDLLGIRYHGLNALSKTLSLSTVDAKTGEKSIIFAEVPESISLSSWKILEQWVQSIKPAEESK